MYDTPSLIGLSMMAIFQHLALPYKNNEGKLGKGIIMGTLKTALKKLENCKDTSPPEVATYKELLP
jgi:hypothetical protein